MLPSRASAQEQLRSPAELATIAKNSQLDYTIDLSRDRLPTEAHQSLNDSRSYQIAEGDGFKIGRYELEKGPDSLFALAEAAYARKDYPAAEQLYRAVLELQPELAFVMTMVGECHSLSGEQDSAVVWWRRAAQENFFDYLPHWFLADAYLKQGEKPKAAAEISLAWILNRNHPKLRAAALEIFAATKLPALDLDFFPNYLVEKKGSRVALLAGEEWVTYGLCKAIWVHEPGSGRTGNYDLQEETECLAGQLAVWDAEGSKSLKKRREYQVLKLAVESRYLAEFIFFELWLPREPAIVYTQPREGLLAIAEYVMGVRGRKK